MDSVGMQYNFDVKIKQLTKINKSLLTSTEIEAYLKRSEESLYQKYYDSFDREERSEKILINFIKSKTYDTSEGVSNTDSLPNGKFFELPSDFKYVAIEEVLMKVTGAADGTAVRVRVKPIMFVHFNQNKNNPFRTPNSEIAWRVDYGVTGATTRANHEIVIPSGYTLMKYYLRYLRKQTPISIATNTTCELQDVVHEELVDLAVDLAIKAEKYKFEINNIGVLK